MHVKRSITLLFAAILALTVFAIDAFTPLKGAIAVLQIGVILMVAPIGRRMVLMVGMACAALTAASFVIGHGAAVRNGAVWDGASARLLVSLIAQAVTVVLSLRDRSTRITLDEQARILELSHDTVIIRDRSDRIIHWNEGAEVLYGWTRDEAIGQNCTQLLRSHASDENIAARLDRDGHWAGQVERTCRNGTRLTLASRWLQRSDPDGAPIGVIESSSDLTAQIRSEAERNHARAQLAQLSAELAHAASVATLGQMSASIVHEVNQPLTAIINYGNSTRRWLNQAEPDMAEVRQCIDRIIASGQRAADVIGRFRDMARKSPAHPEVLDIRDLIGQVLALMDSDARRGGVQLVRIVPLGLPDVIGDRVQVQQVLVNLVMNAVQATRGRAGGCVTIEALSADERFLAVVVRDSGPGVPQADIRRVFDPFYTTKADGMGLGLSICRSLVEAQGGRIEADNLAPHGASFRFTLPLAESGCAPDGSVLKDACTP